MNTSSASEAGATRKRSARRVLSAWLTRFLASDPGLTRLRTALQAVVSIGVALLLEYALAVTARPLMVPDSAPGADAINHATVVMTMMAGAMVVMNATFVGPMFRTLGAGVLGLALVPASMLVGITVGLIVGPYHALALVTMVVLLGGFGFLRRFGSWGFVIGQGLFMGDFLGFFLGRVTDLHGIGWIALVLGIGGAVAIVSHAAMFYPSRWSAVKRLRRSFISRADHLAGATVDLLDHPGSGRFRERQYRRAVALNEAALMLDGQLAESPRLPVGMTAGALHRSIFSVELALTNAARFARALAGSDAPAIAIGAARDAMTTVATRSPQAITQSAEQLRDWLRAQDSDALDDQSRVLLHRFATSVSDYGQVLGALQQQHFESPLHWPRLKQAGRVSPGDDPNPETSPFETSVSLASGWLPGSSGVSASASNDELGQRRSERIHPSVRAGVQMTIAAAVSVLLGLVVSPDRFYWAVLAAFVTFMGANNAAEHVRKGAFRVIGTIIGIVLGALIAHLVGDDVPLSIAIILLALFLGIYMMRISYAFFAAAITVMVAQLYVQLAELSNALLMLRLLETMVGAGVAVLTVIFVLPLPTGRVVRVATREFVESLAALVGPASRRMRDVHYDRQLRGATRDVDAAFLALEAATSPSRAMLRVPGSLGGVKQQWWFAANAAHSYARDLVIDTRHVVPIPAEIGDRLDEAAQLMLASVGELTRGITERSTSRVYTRSGSRFEQVATMLDDADPLSPRQLALRDLQLIDGALASIAKSAGMRVVSTTPGTSAP